MHHKVLHKRKIRAQILGEQHQTRNSKMRSEVKYDIRHIHVGNRRIHIFIDEWKSIILVVRSPVRKVAIVENKICDFSEDMCDIGSVRERKLLRESESMHVQ